MNGGAIFWGTKVRAIHVYGSKSRVLFWQCEVRWLLGIPLEMSIQGQGIHTSEISVKKSECGGRSIQLTKPGLKGRLINVVLLIIIVSYATD